MLTYSTHSVECGNKIRFHLLKNRKRIFQEISEISNAGEGKAAPSAVLKHSHA